MKIKSISKHVLAIVLSLAVLASTLMLNTFSAFAEETQETPVQYSVWDGVLENVPAELQLEKEGANSPENPYLIKSAADFVCFGKLLVADGVPTQNKYYKLTTNIVFNNTADTANGKKWYEREIDENHNWANVIGYATSAKTTYDFSGTFDGDGHVIKGMYTNTEKQQASVFGKLGYWGATIKNLGIEYSYFKSTNSGNAFVAPFASDTHNALGKDLVIENCYAADSVVLEGKYTGGIVGRSNIAVGQQKNLIIRNCYSSAQLNGTIKASVVALYYNVCNLKVENSYFTQTDVQVVNSMSSKRFKNDNDGSVEKTLNESTFTNCYIFGNKTYVKYWDGSKNIMGEITSINKLTKSQMTGANARVYMNALDFQNVWYTEAGKTPQLRAFVENVPTEDTELWKVWNGEVPETVTFDGGTGEELDPYLISTAEQLAYIVKNSGEKKYKLTDDIYLNDVSDPEWYNSNNVNVWNTTVGGPLFWGSIDGNGHTVYGLYINGADNNQEPNYYTGLIPRFVGGTISNIRISRSHVSSLWYDGGHGVLVGMIWQNRAIRNCVIDETVEFITGGYGSPLIGAFTGDAKNPVTVENCYVAAKMSTTHATAKPAAFFGRPVKPSGMTYTETTSHLIVKNSYYSGESDLAAEVADAPVIYQGCYTTNADDVAVTDERVTYSETLDNIKGLTDLLKNFPKFGNVNGDANAVVDICDLVILKKFALGVGVNIDIYTSDVNNDREINGMDFAALQKYILTDASVFQ